MKSGLKFTLNIETVVVGLILAFIFWMLRKEKVGGWKEQSQNYDMQI